VPPEPLSCAPPAPVSVLASTIDPSVSLPPLPPLPPLPAVPIDPPLPPLPAVPIDPPLPPPPPVGKTPPAPLAPVPPLDGPASAAPTPLNRSSLEELPHAAPAIAKEINTAWAPSRIERRLAQSPQASKHSAVLNAKSF
jgi:hypothetical protein